jgi:hypothetical protein
LDVIGKNLRCAGQKYIKRIFVTVFFAKYIMVIISRDWDVRSLREDKHFYLQNVVGKNGRA